jgi:hypothetical protein
VSQLACGSLPCFCLNERKHKRTHKPVASPDSLLGPLLLIGHCPVQCLPYDLPRGFWLRKSSLPAMLYLSLCVAFPIAGLTYLASPSSSLYHALVRVESPVSASMHWFFFVLFVSFMCLCLPPCAASFSAAWLPADSALLMLLSHCWLVIMLSRATCTAKAPSWFGGRWAWGC